MKKFIGVFDGFNLSSSTLEYAIHLTRIANAHLIGVFLDEFAYRNYDIAGVIRHVTDYESAIKLLDEKDTEKRNESVQRFKAACRSANISFTVHRDRAIAQQELHRESLFADLIIINRKETFTGLNEDLPTHFVRGLLENAWCPVVVVPDNFKPIENISLLYDGSPASVTAIKMFSYLFGDTIRVPIQVFTLNVKHHDSELPDRVLIHEFINRHFSNAEFKMTHGDSEDLVLTHLRQYKETWLIVLGAYSRNQVSRWFHSSLADSLMQQIQSPLFVTHGK